MTSNSAGLDLQDAVDRFCALEQRAATIAPAELYHAALSRLHDICSAVLQCEAEGMSREAILETLGAAREIHSRSPFVRRLQDWPRGYPGDFETVAQIVRGSREAAQSTTLAATCESYSLNFPIAQQHRNKIHHQSRRLLAAMVRRKKESRILTLACGGVPDFELIEPYLKECAGELWLNDIDADALERAAEVLESVKERCHFIKGNGVLLAGSFPGEFDLVLAGGLFDYVETPFAARLIRTIYHDKLLPGGTFFFTNIARGNPFRCLIEYMGDWRLIERSEEDILALCRRARVPADAISIRTDETGLALLIDITKPIAES
jgi:extracellular factor (EF) 3-hydroxypalmitic acid methyl ester biosynthesis protein